MGVDWCRQAYIPVRGKELSAAPSADHFSGTQFERCLFSSAETSWLHWRT